MLARARILALTEDSGSQGHPTLQKILKEALKLVVEGVDLNPVRIKIEPLPENDRARLGLRGNSWKEEPPTQDTLRLIESIAVRLTEKPAGFVVFHFDTDSVWSERDTDPKSNRRKFETLIRGRVRRRLMGEGASPRNPRAPPPQTSEEADAALSRLLVFSPCYSMESWLYQATSELRPLCQNEHDSNEHTQLIEEWTTDRTRLDEVHQPKVVMKKCVADHHNETLAKSFPAEDVWLAERSFHESVERLRACTALVEALSHPVS
ncbi:MULTISPECIES: hypothetical protein [unclassified Corallococcus]|uniref:hypothetical protein n=1 Tax=unclassified Corallococcus TaxID=2685029 RepID=UPI001A8E4DFE|nr:MULTISPECIES: hypothetical protein [unclassified Corallococcus]MBN9681133.1 hypothetical protein [Corallococcus sp. NCSPR001]MBN9681140.1 hypothetical protein [Corallococcus sp. NCSPR001]MBN9681143.1 hypothetical protein [Corallococcus sp. NCSPR001]MBN9688588.1 hypothetical protein [Corallococcus sp. NCSPR001]WAS87275.1 hypothetical protein O0N60_09910 [Corallococcus sp. NCRR]